MSRPRQPQGADGAFFEASKGTRIRYIIWPGGHKNGRGGVILLPGRSEFIEKYYETVQDLLNRGFWVAAMDWRGQGLSERPLANRDKHYLKSFAPMTDDLRLFIEMLKEKGFGWPMIIMAHSMGAHVALRFLHDFPGRVDGAALSAPMIDLAFAPLGMRLTSGMTSLATALGLGRWYAPGQTDYSAVQRSKVNMALLTSDPERFQVEHQWIEENPDLGLGGITFGWLDAAMSSIAEINGPDYPEAIQTPILIAQAGADRLIDNRKQEAFARRLPNGTFIRIEGARHEILNESDQYRDQFLAAFDRQAKAWLPALDSDSG